MMQTRREMEKTREKKEKMRQMTREWWRQPASSSTMTWVHTGGARGTTEGEVREWSRRANESLAGQANTTVRELEATLDEIEELELDQTLTIPGGERYGGRHHQGQGQRWQGGEAQVQQGIGGGGTHSEANTVIL